MTSWTETPNPRKNMGPETGIDIIDRDPNSRKNMGPETGSDIMDKDPWKEHGTTDRK